MATTLIVTKADFAAANLVKFSQNIADDQINPYIYAAQEYDLEPRFSAEMYLDIQGVASGELTRPELEAFIDSKVKRFLVLSAYRRFISAHGLNITQFGLSKTADPQGTFEQSSAQDRAIIIKQVDADANVALIKMTSTPYTFDGFSYSKSAKSGTPSASIRAPKRRRSDYNALRTSSPLASTDRPDYLLNSILDIEI